MKAAKTWYLSLSSTGYGAMEGQYTLSMELAPATF